MAPRNSPELASCHDKEKQRAMRIARRWRWQESWWPISWPSIVGTGDSGGGGEFGDEDSAEDEDGAGDGAGVEAFADHE